MKNVPPTNYKTANDAKCGLNDRPMQCHYVHNAREIQEFVKLFIFVHYIRSYLVFTAIHRKKMEHRKMSPWTPGMWNVNKKLFRFFLLFLLLHFSSAYLFWSTEKQWTIGNKDIKPISYVDATADDWNVAVVHFIYHTVHWKTLNRGFLWVHLELFNYMWYKKSK